MSYEKVNQPKHYAGDGITAIQIIEAFSLNFALGNVVKYALRAGRKPGEGEVQDLEKAAWYLARELEAARQRGIDREARKAQVERENRAAVNNLEGLAAREAAGEWGGVTHIVDLAELATAQVESKYAALVMSLEESKGSWDTSTSLSDNSLTEFLDMYAENRESFTLEQQEELRRALYDLMFKVSP